MDIPVKVGIDNFSLPVFGLGTYKMGGVLERDFDNDDERDVAAIRRAIESGITHIDTAELYAAGHCETLVAKAIEHLERSDLRLVSKVMPDHLTYDGVLRAAEGSLERLGTDYLDLYLIHKTFENQDISQAMKAMAELKKRGLIRAIGVSNFSVGLLKKAQSYVSEPIVNNQVHYSLHVREIEVSGLLEYCQKHSILVTAWRPVHLGSLCRSGTEVLDRMCEKYGKTPAQISINWLLSQPSVITICKMTAPEHLKENMDALDFEMEKEDIEILRAGYPDTIDVSPSVPLCH